MKLKLVIAAVVMLPIVALQGMSFDNFDAPGCDEPQYPPTHEDTCCIFERGSLARQSSIGMMRRDVTNVLPEQPSLSVFDREKTGNVMPVTDGMVDDFETMYGDVCTGWGFECTSLLAISPMNARQQLKSADSPASPESASDKMPLQINDENVQEMVISPAGSSNAAKRAMTKKRKADQAFLQLYEGRIAQRLIRMPNHGKLPDAFNAFSHAYCFYRGIRPERIDAAGSMDRGITKIVNRFYTEVALLLKGNEGALAASKCSPRAPVKHCLLGLLQEKRGRDLLWDCWYEDVAASMIVAGTIVAEQGLAQLTEEIFDGGFYNAFCVGLPVALMVKMGVGAEAHWMTVGFMLDVSNPKIPSKCCLDIFSTKHGQDKGLGANTSVAWPSLLEHEKELQEFSCKLAAKLLALADQSKPKRR